MLVTMLVTFVKFVVVMHTVLHVRMNRRKFI